MMPKQYGIFKVDFSDEMILHDGKLELNLDNTDMGERLTFTHNQITDLEAAVREIRKQVAMQARKDSDERRDIILTELG